MACGAGGPGLYGCGAAVRARGASCRATRPAASRLDRLGSYHRGGGRLTSSAPYLTPKWGGMPTQPGPSAPAVSVSRSRSAGAPSAPSLAPFSAERGVRAVVRVAQSGGRFTCVTACEMARDGRMTRDGSGWLGMARDPAGTFPVTLDWGGASGFGPSARGLPAGRYAWHVSSPRVL